MTLFSFMFFHTSLPQSVVKTQSVGNSFITSLPQICCQSSIRWELLHYLITSIGCQNSPGFITSITSICCQSSIRWELLHYLITSICCQNSLGFITSITSTITSIYCQNSIGFITSIHYLHLLSKLPRFQYLHYLNLLSNAFRGVFLHVFAGGGFLNKLFICLFLI